MWPRTDHGQFMVTDWSRTDSRKIPGRCAETSVAIPWTFPDASGKLPGCCADATPDTAPDAARTAAAIAKSFANHRANHRANFGADIHRRLMRRFPLTARMRLGSCSAIARMIHRMLRG